MLTIYRRHKKNCEHRAEGREYRRCRCPVWVDGLFEGIDVRQSLKVHTWDEAEKELERLKKRLKEPGKPSDEPMKLEHTWNLFLADCEARELRPATVYKYRLLKRVMLAFAQGRGLRYLREFDLEMTRAFRASWTLHNLAAQKRLEYLRAFFRFAQEASWITSNPAKLLKSPRLVARPTLPFSQQEMTAILATCDYNENRGIKALVWLLRHTGLRLGDAVSLSADRITDGKLLLYTAKTGTPVYCPLPAFLFTALEAIKRPNGYFFWTGDSDVASVAGNWRRRLAEVFSTAKVEHGHPHRFRDTFAVELLLAGVPLERVSILLGHSSTRITEKHYAPWVRDRQAQLEADVRRTWGPDLIAQSETKGTSGVRGRSERVN